MAKPPSSRNASSAWRAMVSHGLAALSPPEAAHTLLELATNRHQYLCVVQDVSDWPARSAVGPRVPTQSELDRLSRLPGRWRAVMRLDDERALRIAGTAFSRSFVLDPLFDSGDLLYAAWHDPAIRAEHAERLALHASLLVRAAPLLRLEAAALTPDHLPGSWDPRPGWRPRLPHANPNVSAAWALRTAFVLIYWADRLDAVVCTTDLAVAAALHVALHGRKHAHAHARIAELRHIEQVCAARIACASELDANWRRARRLSRPRSAASLARLACCLERAAEVVEAEASRWKLVLGPADLPDPALLIRRVLNGEDPTRAPALPRLTLRRPPLCLVPASA